MERTLVIVKPDAVQRGLIGEVLSRLEKKGLKIVGLKMTTLDLPLLKQHYAHIVTKPFFAEVAAFMSSGPAVLVCVEGVEAVAAVRQMCGITKAREAAPGTIRGDLAMSVQANVVHASEDAAAAEKEVACFFHQEELTSYQQAVGGFVYATHER